MGPHGCYATTKPALPAMNYYLRLNVEFRIYNSSMCLILIQMWSLAFIVLLYRPFLFYFGNLVTKYVGRVSGLNHLN